MISFILFYNNSNHLFKKKIKMKETHKLMNIILLLYSVSTSILSLFYIYYNDIKMIEYDKDSYKSEIYHRIKAIIIK